MQNLKHSSAPKGLFKPSLAAALLGFTAIYAAPAFSQVLLEDENADSSTNQNVYDLGTIVVEARRFEETLLESPVSTTVATQEDLENERIRDTQDLAERTPNFVLPSFGDDPRSALPIVRGIGSLSSVLAPDNSTVPFFLDGAPQTGFGSTGVLLDVEQVEVLRGPQGTLFGRNSTGGAIVVRSRKPDGVRELDVTTEVGTDGFASIEAKGGGVIIEDNLYGRAAIRYTRQNDYITNQKPGGSDFGGMDVAAARASLAWVGREDREFVLSFNYENDKSDVGYVSLLRDSDAYQDAPRFRRELIGLTANYEQDLGFADFYSITSFQRYENELDTDTGDGFLFGAAFGRPPSAFAGTELNFDEERENQFYQEVRLQGQNESGLKWTTGAVASYNDFAATYDRNSALFPTNTGIRNNTIQTTTAAVFGDVTVPLSSTLEASFGGRYTYERERFQGNYTGTTPNTVPSFNQDSTKTYNLWSGRAILSWKPTETTNYYASLSQGAKGGGFSRFNNNVVFGIPETGFDETIVRTVELGAKTELLNGDLFLAATGFYNDIDGEPILGFDPTMFTFPIGNFDLETYGLELEADYRVNENLRLIGSVGYTHAEIVGVPGGNFAGATAGNQVPGVPEFTGSIAIDYAKDVNLEFLPGQQRFFANLSYRYASERAADPANSFNLDEQHVVDMRVGLDSGNWSAYIFGKNLVGDELEGQGTQVAPGVNNVLRSRGRTIGAGLTVRF